MKSDDTPRLGRRRTVMKMEPARPEPSCGPTEASVANSGFQRRPGRKSGKKLIGRSLGNKTTTKKINAE